MKFEYIICIRRIRCCEYVRVRCTRQCASEKWFLYTILPRNLPHFHLRRAHFWECENTISVDKNDAWDTREHENNYYIVCEIILYSLRLPIIFLLSRVIFLRTLLFLLFSLLTVIWLWLLGKLHEIATIWEKTGNDHFNKHIVWRYLGFYRAL